MDPSDPIISLLQTYSELNSTTVDILMEAPSALEFMRYVSLNRPFILRSGAAQWEATRTWNISTLKRLLEGQSVNIAVTPTGNADSPIEDETGELLFVKPWEEQQKFADFVDFVANQEIQQASSDEGVGEVRYAQTQNDNLRNEYSQLFSHVESDIAWARIALRQPTADAINLWIGNSRSVTALHKDNYENIYVQIIGQKHFVLLPPIAHACVAERNLTPASYVKGQGGKLEICREGEELIPFPTYDPDVGEDSPSKYSSFAEPMRLTLEKGDMLYLPAQWYHKVSQSCSNEGICCAVNYWYDMEFGGSFYPLLILRMIFLYQEPNSPPPENGRFRTSGLA